MPNRRRDRRDRRDRHTSLTYLVDGGAERLDFVDIFLKFLVPFLSVCRAAMLVPCRCHVGVGIANKWSGELSCPCACLIERAGILRENIPRVETM